MSEALPTVANEKEIQLPTLEERAFELAQRRAKVLASSEIVPKQFQNNVANCMVAENFALRSPFNVMMIMQNMQVIHGQPSFSAKFLIGCINASKRFGPIQYREEGEGMDRTCVAWAKSIETGEPIDGPAVSIRMAHDEGWATKPGSKWKTMPEVMLRYRSASFFARTVCPEIMLGMYTHDEVSEMYATRTERSAVSAQEALERARDVTPEPEPEPDPIDHVEAAFELAGDGPADL